MQDGGIERDLVRPGIECAKDIVDSRYSAADRERDANAFGNTFDEIEESLSVLQCRTDIQEHKLIGTGIGI